MKKIFATIMVVTMMVVTMSAAMAELKDYIEICDWHFISENFPISSEDGGYADCVAVVGDAIYVYGKNTTISDEYSDMSDDEIENRLSELLTEMDFDNPAVFVKTLSNNIIVVYIRVDNNLKELEDVKWYIGNYNIDVPEEVHEYNVICWRDYASMK